MTTPAPPHTFRPAYHPAGHDTELRTTLRELREGRWTAMRSLLDATAAARDPARWTRRTEVLGAAVAGTDLVGAWRSAEPRSAPAAVMHGRVAVERALRAHRAGHRHAHALGHQARQACQVAAGAAPADPVPWVCLLRLAGLGGGRGSAPPGAMLPPGPWELLAEADRRDRYNREAYHRMLQYLCSRGSSGWAADAADFALWSVAGAPGGSPLHALPLHVRAERARRQPSLGPHWGTEVAAREAAAALDGWFDRAAQPPENLSDLSVLAHALYTAGQFRGAARVFAALGPYYTPWPWGEGAAATESFLRARQRCLTVPREPV
ncbi:hypothetical protein [Streptomyces sp. NPDC050560]|uniref:hypothetical protein n=1 Tax=Streptomyces sp. NPDC050560 TaxID=3365630 RepID=UPI0037A7289C